MKVSISLPADDVEFLDRYSEEQGYNSRSAAVHKAVRLLRSTELGAAYVDAWNEASGSGDIELWDATAGDGLETA